MKLTSILTIIIVAITIVLPFETFGQHNSQYSFNRWIPKTSILHI